MTGQRRTETLAEWIERTDARREQRSVSPHFVYRAYDATGLLLYIGCTVSVEKRMAQHRSGSIWHRYMDRLDIEGPFPGFDEARAAEREAIDTEGAFFNASQADIQRTQANRNAATRRLADCGIVRPQLEWDDLDDPLLWEVYDQESDAYDALRDELCAELKAGEFPYLTPADRVANYLAACSAAGLERVA